MKEGQWRTRSKAAIQEAVLTYCDIYGMHPLDLVRMPEHHERLLNIVSKYYPFGQRKHFPYKAWLKEVRVLKEWLKSREQREIGGLFA
jgi:hypothetical protein